MFPWMMNLLSNSNIPFSIGVGVVTSFGYQKDMDGQWVHKQDLPPPIPDECTPFPPP